MWESSAIAGSSPTTEMGAIGRQLKLQDVCFDLLQAAAPVPGERQPTSAANEPGRQSQPKTQRCCPSTARIAQDMGISKAKCLQLWKAARLGLHLVGDKTNKTGTNVYNRHLCAESSATQGKGAPTLARCQSLHADLAEAPATRLSNPMTGWQTNKEVNRELNPEPNRERKPAASRKFSQEEFKKNRQEKERKRKVRRKNTGPAAADLDS